MTRINCLRFKKICIIALAVIMSVLLCGCSESESAARAAFDNTMNAFKSGDKNTISEYYSFDRITAYIDEADGEEFRDAVLSALANMNYSIKSSKTVSDDAVVLNVDIETVDFSEVVNSFIDKVIEIADSAEYQKNVSSMSDESYNALMTDTMKECIAGASQTKKTSNIDITMIKTSGGKWIIGGNSDEVLGILFADLSDVTDYLT